MLKTVHVSVGDLNGISAYLILKNHSLAKKICQPVYHTSLSMLKQAAQLLKLSVPLDMTCVTAVDDYKIIPGKVSKTAGKYSFASLNNALLAVKQDKNSRLLTMPINKHAWQKGGILYAGHTAYFRQVFGKKLIMLLGCPQHYVALYTDHIALNAVADKITYQQFLPFLLQLYQDFCQTFANSKQINLDKLIFDVLGFNPHAGEAGLIGHEDEIIKKAITAANQKLGRWMFNGPIAADSYFHQAKTASNSLTVAIYHDQGLIGIKSLYFNESIQITLGLPFLRVSPDHGTGFDIAYNLLKLGQISALSYQNALKFVAA